METVSKNQCATASMGEDARMQDLLTTEKALTGLYNTFYSESATSAVKNCLSSLLNDEHLISESLFNEMNSRGWYPVEKAEMTKVEAAKQKFSASVTTA